MPKTRTAEAIWIESRARWQINVQRDGKRKTFTSSTPGRRGKREAEAKADDWLDAGQPDDMRFDAAWAVYLDHIRRNTGTANYADIECIGRNWILDGNDGTKRLSTKRLSKIKLSDLQSLVTAAGEAGKSRRTCKNIKDKISGFFHFAQDQGWGFTVDPSRIKLPTQAKVGERRVIQPDKLKTLFSVDTITVYGHVRPCYYIHAFRLAVALGLRRGEICGLMRSDYDGLSLSVRRSVNRFGETTQGKNDNARRVIVLSRRAKSIVDSQLAMLKDLGVISPWLFSMRRWYTNKPRAFPRALVRLFAPARYIHLPP